MKKLKTIKVVSIWLLLVSYAFALITVQYSVNTIVYGDIPSLILASVSAIFSVSSFILFYFTYMTYKSIKETYQKVTNPT